MRREMYFCWAVLAALQPLAAKANPPTVIVGVHANPDGNVLNLEDPSASETAFMHEQGVVGANFGADSQYANFDDFDEDHPLVEAAWDVDVSQHAPQYITPMLTWKPHYPNGTCPTYAAIANGDYDDPQLISQAHALADVGAPILVRFAPAMDTDIHDCAYGTANHGAEFVSAWRHLYLLVKPIAPNVQFIWAPNVHAFSDNQGNPLTDWLAYWPGNDYVDWYGTITYNQTTTRMPITDMPTFNTWYNTVAGYGKPLILSESGAVGPDPQGCGGDPVGAGPSPQAKFYWSIKANAHDSYPALRGVIIFDACGNVNDYRLRGDGADQVHIMLSNPYFQYTLQ